MKGCPQWINWKPGEPDANGKFAKYPTHLTMGYKVDAHDRANQSSFMEVNCYAKLRPNTGIGFVLNGNSISSSADGVPLYLIGVDIDLKAGLSSAELKVTWEGLNKTYVEVSPSKQGIRMFCLSKELLANRNQNGLEIYSSKRFLTITGWEAKGELVDCTEEIKSLHLTWFPVKSVQYGNLSNVKYYSPPPDTPRNRAWVQELLSHIDPDCDYETYRNVIWSIEAICWSDTEEIGRRWSLGEPERFTEDGLTVIRSSFDRRRGGITFGSLVHYARQGGWQTNGANNAQLSKVTV